MLEYQGENDLRGMIPLSDPNLSDDHRESTSMDQLPAPLGSPLTTPRCGISVTELLLL